MKDSHIDLSINLSNLENSFDRIAKDLFNNYVLFIGEDCYQLTEVEFYCNNYEDHPKNLDNFAHHHEKNTTDGTWRLHSAGLDIVLKDEEYYGGILIRGIQKMDNEEETIDGPWNTATKCIAGQLVENSNNRFYLAKREFSIDRKFKKSPRVGLFLKKVTDLEYICKPWRYNTIPITTQKGKQLLFLQLFHEQDESRHEIVKEKKTQNDYEGYFEAGKKIEKEKFIGKKMTVEMICQLFGCYIQHYNTNKS